MAQSQRTSGGKRGTGGGFDPVDLLRSTLSDLFSVFDAGAGGGRYEEPNADGERSDDATEAEAAAPESTQSIDFAAMEPESALYALLCREGGKMKQSAMVTETDWSKSKVSRRLSNLEENGRIGRVRQGREKVVFVKPGGSETRTEAETEAEAVA